MTDKKTLRREAAKARAAAHANTDQDAALDHLRAALKDAVAPVSFYWPIRTEMDPRPVMEEMSLTSEVALPVTSGYNPLTFRFWTPGTKMEVDGFGVGVPATTAECAPRSLVVPLLAFDTRGHRLGYGAGHYDRTLEQLRAQHQVLAIGLAFAAQEVAYVPTEPTDQPLDLIVTEKGVIAPGALA